MKKIEYLAVAVCVSELALVISGMLLPKWIDQWVVKDDWSPHRFHQFYETSQTILRVVILNLLVAAWIYIDARRHNLSRTVWVVFALVYGVLGLAVYLGRVILAKYELGEPMAPTCAECGYNVYGNTSGHCPECGAARPAPGPHI